MEIKVENNSYEIVTDYNDAFDKEDFISKCTDYFWNYDYIVGDIAYGKLRLKGFYDSGNKNCKQMNNINNLEKYLKENCAYGCKYFVLKKVK